MPTTTAHLVWNVESGVTYKVEYKKSTDSSYVLFQDGITTGSADIPNIDKGYSYDFQVTAECTSGNAPPSDQTSTSPTPTCPSGYTLSGDMTTCYKIDTVAATQTSGGTTLTACHFTNVAYSNFGGWIFNLGGFNQDGTYTTGNAPINLTASPLWANPSINSTDGRLNKCGIWVCGDQEFASSAIGFSRQFTTSSSKVYYIGMGADNYCTLSLNGNVIVQQNEASLDTQFSTAGAASFKNWFIYPIQLEAGINIISMSATNTGNVGVLGVEVYDATSSQLQACAVEADLDPYILFSTKDISDNSDFEVGNWYCTDSTYTLVYDPVALTYSCQKSTYQPST